MKLNYKYLVCLFILFPLAFSSKAQEYVIPMDGNPSLHASSKKSERSIRNDILLELPFEDDFSYTGPYPDINLWADDYAFINNGYAVNPPSIGVATMDAIDWNGSVYSFATISPSTFDADFLTSYDINLAYQPSDSIYLSFFYQPMGTGLAPQAFDSLCLDFYNPTIDKWKNVWQVSGDSLKAFRQVMIPITDTAFLKEGFRFGFRNKASLPKNNAYVDKRGNVDHWNIDYVRLARDRYRSDTIIRDVAFTSPLSSMLSSYEALPWDHFSIAYNTEYWPKMVFEYTNNDSTTRNVTRFVSISDQQWNDFYKAPNATTQDILSGSTVTYEMPSIYPFEFSRGDTARYEMKAWIRTDEFDNKRNDTLRRSQVFKDYFAYDDGSAERSYGLRGQGTNNGLIAVRFNSYISDELGGVDIYFTQLKDSLNLGYYFKLMVWDEKVDDNGKPKPGAIIYEDEVDYTATYTDKINKFHRFEFMETVEVDGPFYAGLLQFNQTLLNIGLDINTPTAGNLLYNLGSEWQISSAPGALLLRPFVKRSYSEIQENLQVDNTFSVFPNPAREEIRIHSDTPGEFSDASFAIYDLSGKTVCSDILNGEAIPVSELDQGIYIISLLKTNGQRSTAKFVIQH